MKKRSRTNVKEEKAPNKNAVVKKATGKRVRNQATAITPMAITIGQPSPRFMLNNLALKEGGKRTFSAYLSIDEVQTLENTLGEQGVFTLDKASGGKLALNKIAFISSMDAPLLLERYINGYGQKSNQKSSVIDTTEKTLDKLLDKVASLHAEVEQLHYEKDIRLKTIKEKLTTALAKTPGSKALQQQITNIDALLEKSTQSAIKTKSSLDVKTSDYLFSVTQLYEALPKANQAVYKELLDNTLGLDWQDLTENDIKEQMESQDKDMEQGFELKY
jgi:hypothetical protein